MRIVHVVDYLMPQMGYQEFLLPKWNALQGHEVFILTSDRYTPFENYDETWGSTLGNRICGTGVSIHEGVKVLRLPIYCEIKSRPFIRGLTSKINELNPDLLMIHGTGSFSIYQCVFSLKKKTFPIFADNHMIVDVIQKGFFQSIYYSLHKFLMQKYISKRIDLFFGVTSDSCDYLHDYEGVPNDKLKLLPLGVDTEIFKPRKKKEFTSQVPVIVQSGKLNYDKKPQWLSEAAIILLKKGIKLKLKFIGNGSETIINDIKKKFYEEGFQSNLEIIDLLTLENLSEEFNEADLVIFPDGTSLSCIEAASCDTVVIMADLPASIEREKKGIGLTYKRGNVNDLAQKILLLLNDKSKLQSLSTSSGNIARHLYSYDHISSKLVKLANQFL